VPEAFAPSGRAVVVATNQAAANVGGMAKKIADMALPQELGVAFDSGNDRAKGRGDPALSPESKAIPQELDLAFDSGTFP